MYQTKSNLKLIELTEKLIDQMIVETGITPQSFNYENDTTFVGFTYLEGIDMKKEAEKYH